MFQYALKHSKTKERVNEVYNSYHTITDKDKAELAGAIVAIPFSVIVSAEVFASFAIGNVMQVARAALTEFGEGFKTIEGTIRNIRKLNSYYGDVKNVKKVAEDVNNGNPYDALKDGLGYVLKKGASKGMNKIIELRNEESSELLIEGIKVFKDLYMKLYGSTIDNIIDSTKTKKSNEETGNNNETKEEDSNNTSN